ncbi:hypothetical protein Theco_1200 [Thermobacillus composti KWC4]|uniref:Uncharacterized protein n=2 Tax=Thermobacillus TaxID=76632 RepID=L0EAU4_THECK|nr:hypothetical protein Theco_1200 [Thermobacillus composti KWC4]
MGEKSRLSGDKLVLSAADGSVSFIELTGPQGGGVPGVVIPPASGDGSAGSKKRIGPAGGELASEDGQARLRIAEGTFAEDTDVSLEKVDLESYVLTDEKGRKLQGYEAWQVSADAAFGRSAELVLGYAAQPEWLAVREKRAFTSTTMRTAIGPMSAASPRTSSTRKDGTARSTACRCRRSATRSARRRRNMTARASTTARWPASKSWAPGSPRRRAR